MSTYLDEGLVTAVYRLEVVAAQTGDPSYIARAKDLENRLKSQWFPPLQAPFIRSDALQLGYELAQAATLGSPDPAGGDTRPNVLYDVDDTLGGPVGTPMQEKFVSGDVGASVQAISDDLATSWSEFAQKSATATTKLTQYTLLALAVLLVLLVLVRTAER